MTLDNDFDNQVIKIESYSTFLVILLSSLLLLCSSCRTQQILQEDQYQLVSSKIKFTGDDKIDNKDDLIFELNSFLKQRPLKRNFWNPRYWFDKTPPLIYDEALTTQTANDLEKYLRNKKGYYHAVVSFDKKEDLKKLNLTYNIDVGPRYKIRSISYQSKDKQVLSELEKIKQDSKIKEGQYLDAATFELERTRLTNALQNRGYLNFNSNYVGLEGDSSNYEADVRIVILPPLPDSIHTKYTNGKINVFTEHQVTDNPATVGFTKIDSASFFSKSSEFIIDPEKLSNEIYLKEGALYNKDQRLRTIRNLSNLSTYKNIYINPQISEETDSIIDFDIFLYPHNNKWVVDVGSDLFYSTINAADVGSKLIGVSASTRFENRNLLGGSERYVLDLEGTLEFDIRSIGVNSYSFNINNYLELPRYEKFFGFSPLFDAVGRLNEVGYTEFQEEANTILNLGFNYSDRRNQLTIRSLNASWGYDYRPSPYSRYQLDQVGFNYVDTEIQDQFFQTIQDIPLIINRLEPTLFTGLLFKNLDYIYQGPENRYGRSVGLIANFELSGFETNIANEFANLFKEENTEWKIGNVNFSKFIKGSVDGRVYKQISEKSSFAARANIGIALPYGRDTLVPYVRQFFVGGPNSIRAWQIRELGPGAHSNLLLNPIENQPFWQTGDIKMEFNLEYRFDVIWYLEGAFFLDGGNVWNLREDPNRAGSQFTASFLDDVALGVGYGTRFDFDYFIIRFDFGYKLRNPFPDPETGEQFVLFNGKYNNPIGNVNIAINYPF